MDENRKTLEKRLLEKDDERIAKLASKARHDNLLFVVALIWLAICIVVSLSLVIS